MPIFAAGKETESGYDPEANGNMGRCRPQILPVHKAVHRKQRRGGVIVFTRDPLCFALSINRRSGEYSDFGGRLELTKDSNIIDCALRELCEESMQQLVLSPEDVQNCMAVADKEQLLLFYPMEPEAFEQFVQCTRHLLRQSQTEENCDVEVVTFDEFQQLISRHAVMTRFLYRVLASLLEPLSLALSFA